MRGVGDANGEGRKVSRFERFMQRYSSKDSLLDSLIDKELGPLNGPIKEALKEEVKRELLRHPRYSELLKKFIGILERLQEFDSFEGSATENPFRGEKDVEN